MEPLHEFGKEAREMEMARIVKKRRNTRRALTILSLVLAASVAFAFREKIGSALTSSTKANALNDEAGTGKKKEKEIASPGVSIVKKWDLPEELLEISGLSWLDQERFACVQDEKGIVFIYNTKSNAIEKQIPFSDPGDYEGLTVAGETAWVIRSDGKLYEISSFHSSNPTVKTYTTPLTAAHNTEGLCYDKKNNRLLVAIKEDEPGNKDYKGIYSFDLNTKKMNESPVMKINLKDEQFAGQLSSKKKKAKAGDAIMPSGIAVHPLTGDIYITEGRNPKLLIINDAASIRKLYVLDKNQFVQPEGISFSPEGELYISNEGTKQPGNILKIDLSAQ